MLRWTKGDISRRNRERRLALVNETVTACAAYVKPEHPAADPAPAGKEEKVLIIT
jgi:hypothetical protein